MKRMLYFLILLPLFTHAAISQWEIIPNESRLSFTATQNDAPVTGEFKTFGGIIFFDANNLKDSRVNLNIDITSLKTSYADLQSTLLTEDWFNATIFPKAQFKANQWEKTGDNSFVAHGQLTIKNKTAPISLTFTAKKTSPTLIHVEGSGLLKRSTYGVGQGEWSSTKEIKNEVKINFDLVARVC